MCFHVLHAVLFMTKLYFFPLVKEILPTLSKIKQKSRLTVNEQKSIFRNDYFRVFEFST